jgi:uncharacterized membrane protein
MEKKDKYDTNPLDPDYVQNADDVWGATRSSPETEDLDSVTREVRRETANPRDRAVSEAPTRRYDNPSASSSYPSVFVPPPYEPPAQYRAPGTPLPITRPSTRAVTGLGLPENLAMILPYAPAYIGLVAAIIELFVVPRSETRVRFHAAQGLALQLAMVAISFLFGLVTIITGSGAGRSLFWLASTVFLIVSMVRVWKGKAHHIAPLNDFTGWINSHLEPRK